MTGKVCVVVACVLWVFVGYRLGAGIDPSEIGWPVLLASVNTVCGLKILREAP